MRARPTRWILGAAIAATLALAALGVGTAAAEIIFAGKISGVHKKPGEVVGVSLTIGKKGSKVAEIKDGVWVGIEMKCKKAKKEPVDLNLLEPVRITGGRFDVTQELDGATSTVTGRVVDGGRKITGKVRSTAKGPHGNCNSGTRTWFAEGP
jgi:hypothetical protein